MDQTRKSRQTHCVSKHQISKLLKFDVRDGPLNLSFVCQSAQISMSVFFSYRTSVADPQMSVDLTELSAAALRPLWPCPWEMNQTKSLLGVGQSVLWSKSVYGHFD